MNRIISFLYNRKVYIGLVEKNNIRTLSKPTNMYNLCIEAIESKMKLLERFEFISSKRGTSTIPYDEVWTSLLPPIYHPDPYKMLISGTGLTHMGSASVRDAMHDLQKQKGMTPSMSLFYSGIQNGKPYKGTLGAQPEWFYKGNGNILIAPNEPFYNPIVALDAGEEPEIVGVYLNSTKGKPIRLGYCLGNELSDHIVEQDSYLYLAHSKLRCCSIGPELTFGEELPKHLGGISRILRNGKKVWSRPFLTGEKNMCHSLKNLSYHHFKYPQHRQPKDIHIHFLGTSTMSFYDSFKIKYGDTFEIECPYFGRSLKNEIQKEKR